MKLAYDPPAAAAVRGLMEDVGREDLLGKVLAALEFLSTNSGDARCRRRSYELRRPLWAMDVRSRHEDWVILWRQEEAEDQITVRYVGPRF